MKKIFADENLWKRCFIIFLMMQPFLDCYILYSEGVTNFFHFSPTTIIRVLFVLSLFAIFFFVKSSKKEKKYLIGYAFLVAIYFIFHHLNAMKFNESFLPSATYSILEEIFYIVRMVLPILIAFITYKIKWKLRDVEKVILFTVGTIAIIIVGSNLLGISLTSYGGNKIIKGSLLTWFLPNHNGIQAEYLTSKGWFYMANQISGLLIMLLPFTTYFTLRKYSFKKLLILIGQIISMILLGTRVAAIGWLPVMLVMIIIYHYMAIVKKEFTCEYKVVGKVFIGILICGILLSVSPVINRTYQDDYFEQEIAMKKKYEKDNEKDTKPTSLYGKISMLSLNPQFYIHLYSYKDYRAFWEKTIELPFYERTGNRNMEVLITKDIYENNNNSMDKWLGMSFSRMRSAEIYIEKDFMVHFYTIGIFGILLFLVPYILIMVIKGIEALVKYKEKFTFIRITLLACIMLTLVVSYLSGHIMDELIVTIFLAFICGLLLKDEEWSEDFDD